MVTEETPAAQGTAAERRQGPWTCGPVCHLMELLGALIQSGHRLRGLPETGIDRSGWSESMRSGAMALPRSRATRPRPY